MTIRADPAPADRDDAIARCERRVELAACYRLIAHFGMSDLIFTHVSARVPGTDNRILINPYGMLFDEIRASDLMEVSLDLTASGRHEALNPAGLVLHRAIHEARPDALCVIHTHSVAGMAVAAVDDGLLPLCQHAMKFFDRIGYHDYAGITLDSDEKHRLVRDLGPHQALVLRNHGLVALGRTVAEAFHVIYHLEQACRVQVSALGMGLKMHVPDVAVAGRTARQFEAFRQPMGQREWPPLLRLLDRLDLGYRS